MVNDTTRDSDAEKNIHTRAYDEMTAGAAEAGAATISAGELAAKATRVLRRSEQPEPASGSDILGSEYGHGYSYDHMRMMVHM